jgi:hypothetical protein
MTDQNDQNDQKPPKKRPSDAAMSGRVATVVLLFLALFVVLFIWGAG